MKAVRTTTLLIATLLLLAGVAGANEEFGRSGIYLRGGLAVAVDASTILSEFVDTGLGLGGAVGYRFHPNLALEGQFHWLGETDIGYRNRTVAKIKRWDTTANIKLSTSGRFQPHLVAGLGYGKYEGTEEVTGESLSGSIGGFVARLGGGLDIYITRNIAIYGEGAYMLTTGDIEPARYASFGAGLMFRF